VNNGNDARQQGCDRQGVDDAEKPHSMRCAHPTVAGVNYFFRRQIQLSPVTHRFRHGDHGRALPIGTGHAGSEFPRGCAPS
jgi:hypothetical protein